MWQQNTPAEHSVTDDEFKAMVQRAMSELSSDHMDALDHVAILIADDPNPEQVKKLQLRGDSLLLGLFEGVPRTMRSGYESGILPDTITIFKNQLIIYTGGDPHRLYEQVKRTVWHEIAHYYGLSHEEMEARQRKG